MARRFEFVDGKSAKFWEIGLDGSSHTVRYGRIGTGGQAKTKDFDSDEKAAASAEKLITKKVKKGYQEVGKAAVPPPVAPPPAEPEPATSSAPASPNSGPDELPRVLLEAPWRRKGEAPQPELETLSLEPLDFAERIDWLPGERALLIRKAEQTRAYNKQRYEAFAGHWWLDILPLEEQLELWNEQPPKVQEHKDLYRVAERVVNVFGEPALPGLWKVLERGELVNVTSAAMNVNSARLAVELARLGQENMSGFGMKAGSWFKKFSKAGATGLIPVALDPEHEDGKVARYQLTIGFAKPEMREVALEVAQSYGPEAKAAVEKLVDFDDWVAPGYNLPKHYPDTIPGTSVPGLTCLPWQDQVVDPRKDFQLRHYESRMRELQTHLARDRDGPDDTWRIWTTKKRGSEACVAAEFGLKAFDGWSTISPALKEHKTNRDALGGWEYMVYGWVVSPRCAIPAARAYHSWSVKGDHDVESAAQKVRRWIQSYPRAMVVGLIPVALGPESEDRELARRMLLILADKEHKELIQEVADKHGPEARAEVDKLLAFDRLLLYPAKRPKKMPKFWSASELPVPRLKNGTELSTEQVEVLAEMLRFSEVSPGYPGLKQVRDACDPDSLDDFTWALTQRWILESGAAAGYWAMHSIIHLGGAGAVRKLAKEIRLWKKGKEKARARVGLETLGWHGSDEALMHLTRYALKAASTQLRSIAKVQLNQVAAERGLSLEELSDRTVPKLDLDDNGTLTLDLGNRSLKVTFNEALKPQLSDQDGPLKRFPTAQKTDDKTIVKAASKLWKDLNKDAQSVAATQISRLERAMGTNRRWSRHDFDRFLVQHPLMCHLARRLVWSTHASDGRVLGSFRVAEDGSYADCQDNDVALKEKELISLAHPASVPDLSKWGDVFADYELLQPFSQLDRRVFQPSAEEMNAKSSSRFEGCSVPAGTLFSLTRRGWKIQDSNMCFFGWAKPLSNTRVCLWFEPGLDVEVGPRGEDQTLGTLALDHGTFAELDPVEFSELMYDVDSLVASVAVL